MIWAWSLSIISSSFYGITNAIGFTLIIPEFQKYFSLTDELQQFNTKVLELINNDYNNQIL